jgi:hypothetical protein
MINGYPSLTVARIDETLAAAPAAFIIQIRFPPFPVRQASLQIPEPVAADAYTSKFAY